MNKYFCFGTSGCESAVLASQRILRRLLTLTAVLAPLCFSGGQAQSAPILGIPRVFDKPTVQQMLDTIEQDRHGLILQRGYFARRGTKQLPGEEGLALLRGALETEKRGSHRWLILQSLYGYAALRVSAQTRDEGFEAYADLFAHGIAYQEGELPRPRPEFQPEDYAILNQSIFDLVTILPVNYIVQTFDGTVNDVLSKAFHCWALLPELRAGQVAEKPSLLPPWGNAVSSFHNRSLIPLADELLKNLHKANHPKVLLAAAEISLPQDVLRSQHYLAQVRPMLQGEEQDKSSPWLDVLERLSIKVALNRGELPELIATQKQVVARTGKGYGILATLYQRSNSIAGLDEIIKELSQSSANEEEINLVGALLFEWKKSQSQDYYFTRGKLLLGTYLSSSSPRALQQELRARIKLGEELLAANQLEEAKPFVMIDLARIQVQNSETRQAITTLQRLQIKYSKNISTQSPLLR